MTRALPILLLAGCATRPNLPPFPPAFDQPTMHRLAEAEPFMGPIQQQPGLWIAWSCETGFVAFVDMMPFYAPDQWIRVADDIPCESNTMWRTPGPANYRTGIEW